MKKKFKIKTIEDIALQFIKHAEHQPPPKKLNSNDTIIDSKFYVKKYFNKKNSDKILSNSFSKLVPYEEPNINKLQDKNKLKLIKFYKIPQKILGEEDEFLFEDESKEKNKKEINNIKSKNNSKIILREIKTLKHNKKTKIFFNLNYRNVYDCINELYLPLMQNIESISSFKSNTENTLSCLEFFCTHNSIFELLNSNEEKNGGGVLLEIMAELKIFEIINLSMILFILHIILEAKIEYIDNFNEDDIVKIYQDSLEALNKIYEIIILILQINEKNNNINNINTNNTSKFIKEFYRNETKLNNVELMINKINENIISCLNKLFNANKLLFGNLVLFKKESGNLDIPDDSENIFLKTQNSHLIDKENNKKEKIYLSKEFNDQYTCFKTMYLFFTKNNNNINKNNTDKDKQKTEIDNYDFLLNTETNQILSKLETIFSSCKEISNNILLYYTNFKILLEKNKVKPPFLGPPSDPKKIFTLVVDLDETLVHYVEEESRAYVQVRPYADYFLTEMGKYFEIVIFTAAAEDYADIVLNELDKNNAIDYKLYRKHTEQINGVFIKDLSKLGRDINKVVIIDNNKDNFSLQPENGLHICSFLGDQEDDELYLLTTDLMKIVKGNKKDLRPAVKEIDAIMKKRYKTKNVVLE